MTLLSHFVKMQLIAYAHDFRCLFMFLVYENRLLCLCLLFSYRNFVLEYFTLNNLFIVEQIHALG